MESRISKEDREKFNDLMPQELKNTLGKLRKSLSEWDQKNQSEFRKTVKSLKHVFDTKKLVIPTDWKEVYLDWYIQTLDESESWKVSLDELIKKLTDRKIILEWAEIYTRELIPEKIEVEAKTEKTHSQKTRIDLEAKYRFYLMDKLGMIDPKGIFYDTNLSLNERAKLLSKILGYNERECKDLLNGKTHFNDEKKSDLDDFLNDLIKKRKK
jgi:hypothetical protein